MYSSLFNNFSALHATDTAAPLLNPPVFGNNLLESGNNLSVSGNNSSVSMNNSSVFGNNPPA
jgi:hypothetical protein